jgi:protein O-GlcNAc transferase
VQITWAGYPDTTGIPAMDYLISDRWQTPPEAEPWLVEKVARMPDGYVCYTPPEYAPPVSGSPAAARGTVTFGCFNRLAKVNAEVVRLWAQLLRECSGSRLVLRARSLADAAVRKRYRKMFTREGVEESRLEFLGAATHEDLLRGYADVDIALDPFPYSGGLTTCEALWMGIPVVTLAGERLASRHSASHLANAGLPELIATSPEQYVAIARDIAGDRGRLAALRERLREQVASSPLGNSELFVRNLLALFRRIWQAECVGARY